MVPQFAGLQKERSGIPKHVFSTILRLNTSKQVKNYITRNHSVILIERKRKLQGPNVKEETCSKKFVIFCPFQNPKIRLIDNLESKKKIKNSLRSFKYLVQKFQTIIFTSFHKSRIEPILTTAQRITRLSISSKQQSNFLTEYTSFI